ncbi:site-specific integrase [uncultured Gimesia sp.]|mgnify:CR=1 FL=1|jgi:site-specific recombinase XerD|uniref:tyrosine-type recombinase/integrase n=1 Tax=uncultured Gimesia sp. TaxID=1678688 RepID=UPI00260A8838|nr:site-specific integrase [uncultured Gimesia sp.]
MTSERNSKFEKIGDVVSIFRRDDMWYANWQWEGSQYRKSLRTKNKKEARRKAVLLEGEILRGEHAKKGCKKPSKAVLVDAVQAYLKHCETERRAEKTLTKYRQVLASACDLAAELKLTDLSQIDMQFIDEFRHRRVALGLADKTVYNHTMIVRQTINYAMSRGMITKDPLTKLKLKKAKAKTQPCWSREEAESILSASTEPHRSILTTLADTGARVGEIKWLTWDDVDFGHNVLHIRAKDGWKPKTGDRRAIPMTSRLKKLLKSRRRRTEWVFTAAPSKKYPNGDNQFSERRLLEYLKRVLKPLGLKGHLHTYRHAFISHAISAGIPAEVVRGMIGHVDDDILKLYTHIADNRKQSAIERFENATDSSPDSNSHKMSDGENLVSEERDPNDDDSQD